MVERFSLAQSLAKGFQQQHSGKSSLYSTGTNDETTDLITDYHKYQLLMLPNDYDINCTPIKDEHDYGDASQYKITISISKGADCVVNERYQFCARAASYLMAGLLILANNGQNEDYNERSRQLLLGKYHNFIDFALNENRFNDGELDKNDFNALKKKLNKTLKQMALVAGDERRFGSGWKKFKALLFQSKVKRKVASFIQMEREVCAELGRPCTKEILVAEDDSKVEQVTTPINELSAQQQRARKNIIEGHEPAYFQALPASRQQYLKSRYNDHPEVAKSAIERGQIGSSNLVSTEDKIYGQNENLRFSHKVISASVPSPIDLPRGQERTTITEHNAKQVLLEAGAIAHDGELRPAIIDNFLERWGLGENAFEIEPQLQLPMVYDSLLSPAWYDFEIFTGGDNNYYMASEKQAAIETIEREEADKYPNDSVRVAIIDTTNPINGRRGDILASFKEYSAKKAKDFVDATFSTLNFLAKQGSVKFNFAAKTHMDFIKGEFSRDEVRIDNLSEEAISRIKGRVKNLIDGIIEDSNLDLDKKNALLIVEQALGDYLELYNYRKDDADSFDREHNKQLFLASLQNLIGGQLVGVSSIHCKSSKDRRGLVAKHTLAMAKYFLEQGKLPKFNDKGDKRERFVEIYNDLARNKHEENQAQLQSAGSFGTKDEMNLLTTILNGISKSITKLFIKRGLLSPVCMTAKDIIASNPDRFARSRNAGKLNKPKLQRKLSFGKISRYILLPVVVTALAVGLQVYFGVAVIIAATLFMGAGSILGGLFAMMSIAGTLGVIAYNLKGRVSDVRALYAINKERANIDLSEASAVMYEEPVVAVAPINGDAPYRPSVDSGKKYADEQKGDDDCSQGAGNRGSFRFSSGTLG